MSTTGSIVEAWQDCLDHVRRPIHTVAILWTSDASGNVSQPLTEGESSGVMSGRIERVVFVPGSGANEPTNGYGVSLADSYGVDLLAGQGAGRSNTAASDTRPNPAVALDDVPTLLVSAAGNGKSGTVVVYFSGGG